MGPMNISKRQGKRQLRAVHRPGRINTPLPSQILHLQLHPNSRIHISWIKHIYRKKGINTCTHPARVKVCGKGQILLLHIEQAPKDVRSKTPKKSPEEQTFCKMQTPPQPPNPPSMSAVRAVLITWELVPKPGRHRQEFPLNFIQFHKTPLMPSRLWHSGTTMRAWPCSLVHQEAAK